MLNFIYGLSGSGKTTYCLDKVYEELLKSPTGNSLIILCPDHMSFSLERELAIKTKSIGGYTRAFILGISRFAYHIISKMGVDNNVIIKDIGKEILLSKVMGELDLSVLRLNKNQPHLINTISAILDEIKISGINVRDLEMELGKVNNKYLEEKLKDIIKIHDALQIETKDLYRDNGDILNLSTALIKNSSWLKGATIFIDGFDDFTKQHCYLIEELIKVASEMNITLCIDELGEDNKNPLNMFHHIYKMHENILSLPIIKGKKINYIPLTKDFRHKNEALKFMAEKFLTFPIVPKDIDCEKAIKIVEASNERLECEAVATNILRLIREENYTFNDFGILLKDMDNYLEELELILEDFGINYFTDHKKSLSHHPLTEFIRSILELVENFKNDVLFRLLKTNFLPIKIEDIHTLENYVLAVGIKGKKAFLENTWQYIPLTNNFSIAPYTTMEDYLDCINEIKDNVVKNLLPILNLKKDYHTPKEYTKALYDYLVFLKVSEKLEEYKEIATKNEDFILAKEHSQVWNILMDLLDQIVLVSGDNVMEFAIYGQILSDALNKGGISLVPPSMEYVSIASFMHNTLNNKRAIFILGATDKNMPQKIKPSNILTDNERKIMENLGFVLESDPQKHNLMERYMIYKGFNLAKEYLYISYPLADKEGKSTSPSMVVDFIKKMFPKLKITYIPLFVKDMEMDYLINHPKKTLHNLMEALKDYKNTRTINPLWLAVYNQLLKLDKESLDVPIKGLFYKNAKEDLSLDLAKKLYLEKGKLKGSVTRFETFASCPFRHFLDYGLKIRPRLMASFSSLNLGTLVHEVMKDFGDYLIRENKQWSDMENYNWQGKLKNIMEDILNKNIYKILITNPAFKIQTKRIYKLLETSIYHLMKFSQNSKFKPKILEGRFDSSSFMPPIVFQMDDFSMEIVGQIDRLDTFNEYYLVMDYKSGKSDIVLGDIFYGLKIQLLTYLTVCHNFMLKDKEKTIPAGMLYAFLKNVNLTFKNKTDSLDMEKAQQKEFIMPGWFLDDTKIIESIDKTCDYIKISLTKNKEIHAQSKTRVKSEEEFHLLMDYLKYLYKNTGRKIIEGKVDILPSAISDYKACKYCNFTSVCGFDEYITGFDYRELVEYSDDIYMDKIKNIIESEDE